MRWWVPAGVLVCCAGALACIQLVEDIDGPIRNLCSIAAVALTLLLLGLWFLFLSSFSWQTRLVGILVLVGLGVLLPFTVRRQGSFTGSGLPSFVWVWTADADADLPELEVSHGRAAIDLMTTTPYDFPQFLGPQRRGVVEGVRLARDWSLHPPHRRWKRSIGLGWSGFAVVGTHAVTQEQRKDLELVVCYDVLTGEPEWIHANRTRFRESEGGDGPRATPTIVGGRVYALGPTGILDCLEGATGKVIWSHNVLTEHHGGNPQYGKTSSPLVLDDLVVVSCAAEGGPTLVAYHKDGKPAWQAGTDRCSYSSPALATLAGKPQILMVNGTSVTGHDPADGRILWEYPWPGTFPKCSQPVALKGDRVFISAGYNAGCALLQIQTESGGKWAVEEVWRNQSMKTEFTNVVERDGYLYGLDDGILACVDPATGRRKWKDRGGSYGYGQILLAGNLLLVQTQAGPVALVEATPARFHELGKLDALDGKTWNNPALAGKYLLVRNDQEAACYELPLEQPSQR
jgi:outer membrane protein assembly factor BamB